MNESTAATDLGVGLAMVFGALSLLAALGATGAAYAIAVQEDQLLQTLSGVGVGLAMVFGGLAVAALHVYGGDRGRNR